MIYSKEFKLNVLQYYQAHSQCSYDYTAKQFNITAETVHKWVDPEYAKKVHLCSRNRHKQKMVNDPIYKQKFNEQTNQSIRSKMKTDSQYHDRFQLREKERHQKKFRTDPIYRKKCRAQWRHEQNKYRNRKRNLNETFTINDQNYIFALFNHHCAYCNTKRDLCIDHWMPLSKGHPLTKQNAVVLCRKCNSAKHNKLPIDYYPKIFVDWIEKHILTT